MKMSIMLVRKIVPNYWECKIVDSKVIQEGTLWTKIPHSHSLSISDIQKRFTTCTVVDVTEHFKQGNYFVE